MFIASIFLIYLRAVKKLAIKIPFKLEHNFEYAKLERLTPLVRRVTARNPSGFTFHGTGTYIIGREEVAVIDPGPLLEEHIAALKVFYRVKISRARILITHTHMDHSAAAPLKNFWSAKLMGSDPTEEESRLVKTPKREETPTLFLTSSVKMEQLLVRVIGISNVFIHRDTPLIISASHYSKKIRCLLETT